MPDKTATDGERAVDEYLASVHEPFRTMLAHLRGVIRAAAPEAVEAIGYGIPTYKLDGNLVHFAAFKNHMSFFPGSTAHNEALKDALAGYKLSKGTIQFTPDNPLPDELVTRIVKLRIAENRDLAAGRKAAKRKR
jgi:uncharacterized protein YdhG (YjbR/CyaY superfamily)